MTGVDERNCHTVRLSHRGNSRHQADFYTELVKVLQVSSDQKVSGQRMAL